jgi:hypothetical protein
MRLYTLLFSWPCTLLSTSVYLSSAALFQPKDATQNVNVHRGLLANNVDLRRRFQTDLRRLQGTALSPVGADAYAPLLELTVDADDNPNPRVTCTEGYGNAAD